MKLFTASPEENMSEEEIKNYLAQVSKALLEITMKINLLEKKISK